MEARKKCSRETALQVINWLITKEFDKVFNLVENYGIAMALLDLKKEAQETESEELLSRVKAAEQVFIGEEIEAYWIINYTRFTSVEEYYASLCPDAEDDCFCPDGEEADAYEGWPLGCC